VEDASRTTVADLFGVAREAVAVSVASARRLPTGRAPPRRLTGSWLVSYEAEVPEAEVAAVQAAAAEASGNASAVSASLRSSLAEAGVAEQGLSGFVLSGFQAAVSTPPPTMAPTPRPVALLGLPVASPPTSSRMTCAQLDWQDEVGSCFGPSIGRRG
ncbi:unnamed protein product, partial [Prorocentrum cordatum]